MVPVVEIKNLKKYFNTPGGELHAVLNGVWASWPELLCALAFAAGAALPVQIPLRERTAEYEKREQSAEPPNDGYEIKNRERLY